MSDAEVSMESVILEVRAAEGGDDAKQLVDTLFGAYVRRCARLCL